MVRKKLIQASLCIVMLASSIAGAQLPQSEKEKLCDLCHRAKYWSVKMERAGSEQELEEAYKKYTQSKEVCDAKKKALSESLQNREFKLAGTFFGGFVIVVGGVIFFLSK